MALIEFKNKPDATTPINADNLNHNFNELDTKLAEMGGKIGDLSDLETINKGNIVDAINDLVSSMEFKDYTSQCTFMNCTLQSGKIMKFGKLVIIQITITPTITHEWGQICIIPEELYPLAISGNGTAIIGSDFWVYTDNGIMGSITSNKLTSVVGIYLSQA